jgi:hypothetical protein
MTTSRDVATRDVTRPGMTTSHDVTTHTVTQNALPAVDYQQCRLQVSRFGVVVDSGSRLNEDPKRGCRDGRCVVKGTAGNLAAGSEFPWRDVTCHDLVWPPGMTWQRVP